MRRAASLFLIALAGLACSTAAAEKRAPAKLTPTFNRDIAPLVFRECVVCHRAGELGSFPLTTFREVKKRAALVARVTAKRYMPPWPPEEAHGDFVDARRLTDTEIDLIARWVKGGAPEGAKADLPPLPKFPEGWRLGPPDLIVTLPAAYPLAASGPDAYRNFTIPAVVPADRLVRALEFRPGDTRAIHHAFVFVDESGDARRLEKLESAPGFPGMMAGRGARSPEGFVSWQPGKRPSEVPEGMAWRLRKNADLVLQMHLRPTGKPEQVQPRVGLYFTDQPPTRSHMILLLRSAEIDIPAQTAEYAIESSYQLPVPVRLIGLQPHMHFLGREAHGWAELPDGTRQELLLIKRWDFNWQGDYRYVSPVALPKGTTLKMRYVFDNSEANTRNPNQPPARVQYGLQSSDEMGELWFWLETATPAELAALRQDYFSGYGLRDNVSQSQAILRREPHNSGSRTSLGVSLAALGRMEEGLQNLRQAIADDPANQRAHFVLGTLLIRQGKMAEAKSPLTRAVELDPNDAKAQSNLGDVLFALGDPRAAIVHYDAALRLDPGNKFTQTGLAKAKAKLR